MHLQFLTVVDFVLPSHVLMVQFFSDARPIAITFLLANATVKLTNLGCRSCLSEQSWLGLNCAKAVCDGFDFTQGEGCKCLKKLLNDRSYLGWESVKLNGVAHREYGHQSA